MHLQPQARGPKGLEMQQALVSPACEVDPDGLHVARDLVGRLFEGEIDAPFAAPAGGVGEMRGNAGLAASGGAGYQQGATTKMDVDREHGVQFGDAGRYNLR